MLLSRIFSLMLGTTMFVMIWSMQDGDHGRHLRAGAAISPSVRQPGILRKVEEQAKPDAQPAVSNHPVGVTSVSTTPVESALWMFADETPERIAIK